MRFNRKKFDNAYDRCCVSVPKSDGTYKNGMDNIYIKEDILNLYRFRCTGSCTKQFATLLKQAQHFDIGSDFENMLFSDLHYFYCYSSGYEWWDNGKKVNWFDPREEGTWQQILKGCRPLFELFDEEK